MTVSVHVTGMVYGLSESQRGKHLALSLAHGKCSIRAGLLITLFTDEGTEAQSSASPAVSQLESIGV